MKKLYTLAVLLITAFSYGQVTELYFSKYAEGSSNNKFLEIYNGTSADISLSNYAFPSVSNAPTVAGEHEYWNTFPDGAVVAAGDVYVIAHPSADASILAQADMTHTYLSNGDDGYALVSGTETDFTVLDWIGNWDADPGSGWEVAGIANGTKDHTLTRKSSVCGPNNSWAAAAGTNADDSEWIVGDIDSGWDTLGSFTGCVSADPCDGVTGAPSIADDFDGGATDILEYHDDQLTTAIVDGTALGATGNVMQYVDAGGQYANVQLRTCNKFDMAVTNLFTMDVYIDGSSLSGSQPNQVQFKLQDRTLGAPWETQVVSTATIDAVDTWQTVSFNFTQVPGAVDRTDIDNVVIQFNGENNSDTVTAYIDNITSSTAPVVNYNVTFEVDARNIITNDQGMYLGGGVFGDALGYAMTDADGDGIWTVTIELAEGTTGNYIFLNGPNHGGDWSKKEDLTGLDCADAANWNDRLLPAVTGDTTISYCFASCDASCTPVERFDVTFNVDTNYMTDPVGANGIYLGGGIFGGSNAIAMSDTDADGIYTKVVSVPTGTTGNYVFFNSPTGHEDWATKEDLAGLDCADTNNFNDRILPAVTADTSYTFLYGSCASTPPGNTCDNPLVIDALPYTTSDNTANYGDDYENGSSPCSSYYMSGDDVVYSFTPDVNMNVDFSLTDIGATYAGMHIMDGCIDSGDAVCVASSTSSSTADRLVNADLVAGTTYYIVISTWATPQSTTYTLGMSAVTCPDPTALAVSAITDTAASLSWTAGGSETTWEYQVVASGTTPAETGTETTDNPLALSGLTANTAYDVYLRAVCAADDSSNWVSVSFTTACESITPNSLETFDTVAPDCWSEGTGSLADGPSGTSSGWYADGFGNVGSSGSARFNIYATGGNDWLVSPTYDLSAGGYEINLDVALTTFSGTSEGTINGEDAVHVVQSVDGGATWTVLYTWDSSNVPSNTGDNITIDISSVTSDAIFALFALEDATSGGDYNIYIDNFAVRTPPACLVPQSLSIAEVTTSSASLSWTAGGSESSWEYQVVASGATPAETGTVTSDNPLALSGLSTFTAYDVYLRAICDDGSVSEWVMISFTTNPGCGSVLTDSGGVDGDYAINENTVTTVYPENEGDVVTFTFNSLDTEVSSWSGTMYDYVTVYDGPDTNAAVVGVYGGTEIPDPITSTHATGALTLAFYSDSSVVQGGYEVVATCGPVMYEVTFNVNTANITVGASGMYLGGGIFSTATAHPMSDADGDGIYSVTLSLAAGTAGNYIFLNGPAHPDDWGTKENLAGLPCADAANWNDRYLEAIAADTVITYCFATCEESCPADPCAGVEGAPAIADDFDGNSVDILEYFDDNNVVTTIMDGAAVGASSNVLQYVDNGGQYANVQLRTCNKFDMQATNLFTMDVYIDGSSLSGSQPNQVAFKLQDRTLGAPWESQIELIATIDAVDTWQTVEFDFHGTAAMTRTDLDNVVIQFNGENNFDTVTAYIDNIQSGVSLGIDDNTVDGFTFYPNPVDNQLNFKSQSPIDGLTVYNMLGQAVLTVRPSVSETAIDVSGLRAGAYFVQVQIGATVKTVKVIKN